MTSAAKRRATVVVEVCNACAAVKEMRAVIAVLVVAVAAVAVSAVDLDRLHATVKGKRLSRTALSAGAAHTQLFGARSLRAQHGVQQTVLPIGADWKDSLGVSWLTADNKLAFTYALPTAPAAPAAAAAPAAPAAVMEAKTKGPTAPTETELAQAKAFADMQKLKHKLDTHDFKADGPVHVHGGQVMATQSAAAGAPSGAAAHEPAARVLSGGKQPVYQLMPRVATLYHATTAPLAWDADPTAAPTRPLWLSPDVAQSISGGLFKYRDEHDKKTSTPEGILLYEVGVNTVLNLFPLPPCATTGVSLLANECRRLTKGVTDCFKLNPQSPVQVYRPTMSLGSPKEVVDDVKSLCAVWKADAIYDGWRAPWDQDEVMVCPHALWKLNIPKRVVIDADTHKPVVTPGAPYYAPYSALPFSAIGAGEGGVPVTGELVAALPANHPHHTHGAGFHCLTFSGSAFEAAAAAVLAGGDIGSYQTKMNAAGGVGATWARFIPVPPVGKAACLYAFAADLHAKASGNAAFPVTAADIKKYFAATK